MTTLRGTLTDDEIQAIRAAAAVEIKNAPPATPAQLALMESTVGPALRRSLAQRKAAA